MLIPDFEIDAMTRVLLPAFRAFYASLEGQAAFDGGGTSRRIHNKSDPATWTGAVCLCSDTIQINNKSEPIPDGGQVRIMLLWWTIWGSNPRPQRCERCALPAELTARIKLSPRHYSNKFPPCKEVFQKIKKTKNQKPPQFRVANPLKMLYHNKHICLSTAGAVPA